MVQFSGRSLSDCERKSCEPIAALGATSPDAQQRHDNLLYSIRDAIWDGEAIRRCAAREAIEALEKRGGVTAWVADDTGFPKQGRGSVGVQRQYGGTLGKIGNCQIRVSLAVATQHEHVPVDFALYLPARAARAARAAGAGFSRRARFGATMCRWLVARSRMRATQRSPTDHLRAAPTRRGMEAPALG